MADSPLWFSQGMASLYADEVTQGDVSPLSHW